jgi:hypothetical protein
MAASESHNQELPAAVHPSTSDTTIAATIPTTAPIDAAPSKSNPAAPTAYKIVKVRRKPDGAIIKVRRPVEPGEKAAMPKSTSTAPAQSSTKAPEAKETEAIADKHEVTKAPSTKISQSQETEQPASDVKSKTPQSKAPEPNAQVVKPKTSQLQGSEQHTQAVKPKTSKKDSKRSTVTRTYRLFRGVHRIGRKLEHVAGAFDPSGDLGDDADNISSDSFSDSSSSSDDDRNHHKHANGRKQNTTSKNNNDNDSIHSWQDGDSEYQESEKEDDKTQRQSTADSATPLTSKEENYTVDNVMSPTKMHESKATDNTSVKGKPGVEVNEKEVTAESDSVSLKPKRRSYHRLKKQLTFSEAIVWAIMVIFPTLFIGNICYGSHCNCCTRLTCGSSAGG